MAGFVEFDATRMVAGNKKLMAAFRSPALTDAIIEVHDKAAREIQRGMVNELNAKIGSTGRKQGDRPGPYGHKKGALALSLLDERNRVAGRDSMLVGVESWLDRSPAKWYYRSIEEGMGTFSDEIAFFDRDLGKRYGPYSPGGMSKGFDGVLRSRSAPPGYKNLLMGRGLVFVQDIGPYPAYHYTRGGRSIFRSIQWQGRYERAFARVGIALS